MLSLLSSMDDQTKEIMLKLTAIDHIKDGERRERQAKRAAGLDHEAALEVKKPVGKAFSV